MSNSGDDLKGAVERWQTDENSEKLSRRQLVEALTIGLEKYSITELAEITGINRSTIYYMLYGRSGKGGREHKDAA